MSSVEPPVRIVRDSVWLMLSFIISMQRLAAGLPHVLADAVEDDHRVVDRVADQGQEGRDRRQVELEAEQGEEAEGHQHVVEQAMIAPTPKRSSKRNQM